MEPILSIMGIDPKKIKFDQDINVTQDHINQLFAGVAPLLEKYHKDNPLKCDSECKANKQKDNAYAKYLDAKKNLSNAPQEFEEAEKNFLTLSHSGQSYLKYKETQAGEQIKNIIIILDRNFTNKVTEIQERIDSVKAQSISSKHMTDLEKSYGRDIYQIDNEINEYQKKNNINDRLSVYYNRQIQKNRRIIFYIRIIYWMMLVAYLFYFMVFQKIIFTNKISYYLYFSSYYAFLSKTNCYKIISGKNLHATSSACMSHKTYRAKSAYFPIAGPTTATAAASEANF